MKTKIHPMFSCACILVLTLTISSCQSNIPTKIRGLISTATISIETLRATPDYMAGCKKINPGSVNIQASYKGIYPGHTTKNKAENILGKPLRTNEPTSWEYGNLAIVFDGIIVRRLFVAGDSITTLKDMILQYGCPDAIYALDTNEEHQGEYSRLLFIYPGIGLDFTIDYIPTELNEKINDTSYFMPGTLEYYSDSIYALGILGASKPMTWNDAVR